MSGPKSPDLQRFESALKSVWYRRLLCQRIPELRAKWEPQVGVEVA